MAERAILERWRLPKGGPWVRIPLSPPDLQLIARKQRIVLLQLGKKGYPDDSIVNFTIGGIMGASKRRRRQFAIGFRNLARICGKSVKGGRPIYRRSALGSIAEAIERERAFARRQALIKRKK